MSGAADHDRSKIRPFLIERDKQDGYRLVVRETRYNSQNYPIVTATAVAETFSTTSAARAYAKANFGAQTGEFATK